MKFAWNKDKRERETGRTNDGVIAQLVVKRLGRSKSTQTQKRQKVGYDCLPSRGQARGLKYATSMIRVRRMRSHGDDDEGSGV